MGRLVRRHDDRGYVASAACGDHATVRVNPHHQAGGKQRVAGLFAEFDNEVVGALQDLVDLVTLRRVRADDRTQPVHHACRVNVVPFDVPDDQHRRTVVESHRVVPVATNMDAGGSGFVAPCATYTCSEHESARE